MKTHATKLSGALLCSLCAMCGGQATTDAAAADQATASATDQSESALSSRTILLALRGDDAALFSAVDVKAGAIDVTVDGTAVTVHPTGKLAHLKNTGNATPIATFTLPAGAAKVTVALSLDSGTVDKTTTLIGSVAPMVFKVSAESLLARRKMTVHLDVDRSVVPSGDPSYDWFVPQGHIKF